MYKISDFDKDCFYCYKSYWSTVVQTKEGKRVYGWNSMLDLLSHLTLTSLVVELMLMVHFSSYIERRAIFVYLIKL